MGNKRKNARVPAQLRSRTTRSKGKALPDPEQNTQLLTQQLQALGLYAAHTVGDGNCLFRALSDQLYGSSSYHLRLREDICNWIDTHRPRYEPFVDDERGLDVHLRCMRQPATYGGHLELSAFAHMTRRNVKVIQPGLVYVIEWDAGADPLSEEPVRATPETAPAVDEDKGNDREKRRLRRGLRSDKQKVIIRTAPPVEQTQDAGPVYVAYHDWEHFSSIRNLSGPHVGLPNVIESPMPDDYVSQPVPPPSKKPVSKTRLKSESKAKSKPGSKRVASSPLAPVASTSIPAPTTPSLIPLPISRSPSPVSSSAPSSVSQSLSFPPYPPPPLSPTAHPRSYRSPKRTFDESSASSSCQSVAKRARSSSRPRSSRPCEEETTSQITVQVEPDADADIDFDTPDLSASGFSPASTSSLSSVPSPEATPPPMPEPTPVSPDRPLTRRQRKLRGLPKPRQALGAGSGKIIIPGGKYKKGSGKPAEQEGEWTRNGTGRLDVRGFRELKI